MLLLELSFFALSGEKISEKFTVIIIPTAIIAGAAQSSNLFLFFRFSAIILRRRQTSAFLSSKLFTVYPPFQALFA